MDEIFYKDLLEKAIAATNVHPNDIDTKGFFKWNFFSVEELNERIAKRNEKIENGTARRKELIPLKKRGMTSHSRYDRIITFSCNPNHNSKRSDTFLINELTKSNIFYAVHASFVGTFRYRFKLMPDNTVKFTGKKMILIR
jgi:uncharacterized small protein (DUF1192 family)